MSLSDGLPVKGMNSILLMEKSPTARLGLERLFTGAGYQVNAVNDSERAREILLKRPVEEAFSALVLGLSMAHGDHEHALLRLLGDVHYQSVPTLVLSHDNDGKIFEWVARRQRAALLSWDDYRESTECLTRLLSEESQHSSSDELGGLKSSIRVLFVDDSRTARLKFVRLLEGDSYQVSTAANCQEAMAMAKQDLFDIVISDYFMPGGNGDELCRMLQDDPATSHITTAVITGTYLEDVIRDTLSAGAVECMFKNEADELFLARVASMSRSVHARNSIEAERQRLSSILSSVGDGVYGVDSLGKITFMNPTARSILGLFDNSKFLGKRAHGLFHYADDKGNTNPEENCILQRAYQSGDKVDTWQTVFWNSQGKGVQVECTALPLNTKKGLEGAVVAFRDITDRKRLEQELVWQAHHDALTKLHNRRFFEQQLEEEVFRAKRSEKSSALLYIDLDRFKYINDTAGHAAGDQLLIEVSNQLKERLRDADLLARLGGDEFAIILTDTDHNTINETAESFREVLEQCNFVYEGKQYRVYGSIGAVIIDQESESAGDVLANADIACHIAKSRGRNQIHIYHHENDEKVVMNMQLGWSERLHSALETDSFALLYQPIMPLGDIDVTNLPVGDGELWNEYLHSHPNQPAHYETLIRFVGKSGELVSPNAFLPTAERFGIMPQIDIWVMTRAIEQLAKLKAAGQNAVFTVNISGETLEPERLAGAVTDLMKKHQLNPGSLVIEITESSAIENIDSAKQLINELRVLGCRFALDDFGSGFSSFSHLKHLPVDYVKIDGQFVRGMTRDPSDRSIISSINDIAHSFGKQTIAEFVEGPEILNWIKKFGVDYAQGYYVSEPLSNLIVDEESPEATKTYSH